MATSTLHMWTTLAPAPDGFTRVHLSKRHLLSGPVVVLVPDLATLGAVVPDYAARMQGIVLTPGPGMQLAFGPFRLGVHRKQFLGGKVGHGDGSQPARRQCGGHCHLGAFQLHMP